jgi:hypothetical protein
MNVLLLMMMMMIIIIIILWLENDFKFLNKILVHI